MSTLDQFIIGLRAFKEIQAELNPGIDAISPSNMEIIEHQPFEQMSLSPEGSLLLGLAEEGQPILLDLYNADAGPLLVAGDGGTGKTAFLKHIAIASALPEPGEIQFGVVTPFPEEWIDFEGLPHSLGVWPAYHPFAQDFLIQLVNWAEALPETRQVVLLLVDGLDLLAEGGTQSLQCLRWLLANGPERHIWPIVTANPARLRNIHAWTRYFSTRILSRVKNSKTARELLYDPSVDLGNLIPGIQFGLAQPEGWLKFLLPPQV